MFNNIPQLNRACFAAVTLLAVSTAKEIPDLENGGADIGAMIVAKYDNSKVAKVVGGIPITEIVAYLNAMVRELEEVKITFSERDGKIIVSADSEESAYLGLDIIKNDLDEYLNLPVQMPKQSLVPGTLGLS